MLTRTACVVAALGVVAVSVWVSLALVATWANAGREAPMLQGAAEALAKLLSAWSFQDYVALAVIVFSGVAVTVASRASLEALFARYRRRVMTAAAFLMLLVVALIVLTAGGWAENSMLLNAILGMVPWLGGAVVAGTLYLFWRTVTERILAPQQAAVVVLVSAGIAVAWVMVLSAAGAPISQMPFRKAALALSPALWALMALVLAPWSLSRIRHL